LSSQAEVDSFPAQYCSTLCSLVISGNDITNLDSLYVLQKVGALRITFNPVLTDISGLSNLTAIEANCSGANGLDISSNNLLPNLDGLSSLGSINTTLTISSNTMLANIDGLSHLNTVGSSDDPFAGIEIENNASLENVDGLSGFSTIASGLTISGNPGLTNLEGLRNTTTIGGHLEIAHNDALTSVDGLRNLATIGLYLSVEYNSHLTSLAGLANVNHIGQWNTPGMSLVVSNNDLLPSLNGLQGLDTIPGTATIEGNEVLTNLNGLSSLRTFSLPGGGASYNSGIRIASNNSLVDVSGISGVENINAGRTAYFMIQSNPALQEINLPNLKSVEGYFIGQMNITGNAALKDLDGLSSLASVRGGYGVSVEISNNTALQDIDGLSSLANISAANNISLRITDNTTLGRFCGLYTLIHNKGINCGGTYCYSPSSITISGNERNPTPEEIEAEGPCGEDVSQPTNLVFSNVTSEGMKGTFHRSASFASGYLVLMKAYGAPAEDITPEDGTTYHVGQVLGNSTIVVSAGADTTFTVSGLVPSTPYYFDIYSWKVTENGNDYLTTNPLEAHQSTAGTTSMDASISFSDVTDESMTVTLDDAQPGNYIALMKAFGYPSPNDVPVDGHQYHVGNTIGSSTIVVNIGDGSSFTVNGLVPGVTYYFDIYQFDAGSYTYNDHPSKGKQATTNDNSGARIASAEEELRPYPNPFEGSTSIPFVVKAEESTVHVAIYDLVGREVNTLVTGSYGSGRHEANWDGYDKNGRRVNAGVYVYSVKSDAGVVTGRVSVR